MKSVMIGLSLLSLTLLLGGCDGDPDPNQAAKLLGAWESTHYVASDCLDPDDNENSICTSNCEILVIDATTITSVGEGKFTYTTSGNSITINITGTADVLEFSVSGAELTFTHQDSPADGGCYSVSTYKKYDTTVTDADGNVYNTIFIGEQEWMKENLRTQRYSNGAEIQNITETSLWVNAFAGAYSDYDNSAQNADTYGRLYNYYAVTDNRNVCPTGWHVPSLDEWGILVGTLGGANVAGGKMKSKSDLWGPPNEGATNESKFSALPAGTRFDEGDFRDMHGFAHWKSSDGATIRLQTNLPIVEVFYNFQSNGSSIRCVKD